MYAKACDQSELREGKYEVAAVNRTLVLVVWPKNGQPRAFQGMCPHANEPLADARFDGETLTCAHHDWSFDGTTGECFRPRKCTLAEYPLKIENGEVLIDTDGITPVKLS